MEHLRPTSLGQIITSIKVDTEKYACSVKSVPMHYTGTYYHKASGQRIFMKSHIKVLSHLAVANGFIRP